MKQEQVLVASMIISIVSMLIKVYLEFIEESRSKKFKIGLSMIVMLSLLSAVIEVPKMLIEVPEIYPGKEDIDPENDMISFHDISWGNIYYTLDGSTDPEYGEIYSGPIEFSEGDLPLTVMAKTKIWWLWSDRETKTYREARRSDGSNSDNSEGLLNVYNLNSSIGFGIQTFEGVLTINSYVSAFKTESDEVFPDGIASGWYDSDGGRENYSIEEINDGILGDRIIFNAITISDEDKHKYPEGTVSHEKNFVGARVNNGSYGTKNVWEGNLIEVIEGEEYFIRIYCHNNSPNGYDAVAEDVEAFFHVPTETGRTIVVHGFFQSSNASPTWYSDSVVMTSDRLFHLEYIPGSALLENNGIGSSGGQVLDDKIVNESWTRIGYSALDGKIPGCYQYSAYLTIRVKPIFEE